MADAENAPEQNVVKQENAPESAAKKKELVAEKVTGVVKWFNVKTGFGFITRDDTKEDVFVHQTAIIRNNPKKAVRSVGDGESVEFNIVAGTRGLEASDVTGPGGEAVQGSTHAADKRDFPQHQNQEASRGFGRRGRGQPNTRRGGFYRSNYGRGFPEHRGGFQRSRRGGHANSEDNHEMQTPTAPPEAL